jgi:serine protease
MRARNRRPIAIAIATGALLTLSLAGGAFADAGGSHPTDGMVVLRPWGQAGPGASTTSPLTFGGGQVQTTSPKVYISWWGSQWNTGFSTGGYTSAQAQAYMTGFFGNVGGSTWNNIDTQYCQGIAKGTTDCTSGTHITNPSGQLAGDWNDTSALPNRVNQSAIANAALRLMNHFGGYDPNATYFVFTPSGHSMQGFRTSWCAWHSVTTSGTNQVAYAYMPYIPDAGANCGMNFVNKTNNTFGNGYFDGFSVVGGHEYAEAQTDPHPSNGWTDSSGAENGDKCAWNAASANITLGSNSYAIQPIWSNVGLTCLTNY